jgi:kynureninase
MDMKDPLKHLRDEFHIPSRKSLKSDTLEISGISPVSLLSMRNLTRTKDYNGDRCVYLVGNQIGLQPRLTSSMIQKYLSTWASQGMFGLVKQMADSSLPSWLHADTIAAEKMARIVGALKSEVSVMGNLTTNLHLLMASFYKPDKERTKIIIERDTFSSDYVSVKSFLVKICH